MSVPAKLERAPPIEQPDKAVKHAIASHLLLHYEPPRQWDVNSLVWQ
jgi:hypothetical protein